MTGARHLETEPLTDADDVIAAALQTVSVPALMAAVVYTTGNAAHLRGPIRPHEWVHNEFQGKLTEDEKVRLRRDALVEIRAWRDAGCPPPPTPDPQIIRETMNRVACKPDWHDFPRTANAASAARREVFARWISDQIGDDPDLVRKVTPSYPPMAKRMLQDNGSWLRCLTRDHVGLVTDPITDIGGHTISTADASYDVDVIVLATGFRAGEVLWPMGIIGRDGASLHDVWGGRPSAYNGVSVPGFPNFFMMTGPGTGLAHAGSVITMSELQMRYIGAAVKRLLEGGHRRIEPTPAAHRKYHEDLQREVATLMWAHPSIEHSWYKSADGNVYALSPWRLVDYWNRTAKVADDDHILS